MRTTPQTRGGRCRYAAAGQLLPTLALILAIASAVMASNAMGAETAKPPKSKRASKPVTPLLPRPTNSPPPVPPRPLTNAPPPDASRPITNAPPPAPARPVTNAPAVRTAVSSPAPAAVKFPEPFARLNYDPLPKPDYPTNPRREVKGLYVTLTSASSTNVMRALLEVVDQTAINALVIDVKDDVGRLLHRSDAAAKHNPKASEGAPIRDLAAYVKRLRDRKVYTIARIVTFKDPIYAEAHPDRAIVVRATGKLFRSQDKLAWGSPHDAEYRAYNLAVAREAALAGFNEIQFDYIRFPEVADDAKVDYRNPGRVTKAAAVQSFLLEARRLLSPLHVYISADVFGLVCAAQDDMNLGQFWEAVSNAVDYICPMAYPSHYAPGSYGLAVPDLHPHDLMDRAARDALRRNRNLATPARVRPWIQGFTARWLPKYRRYGVPEIKAQIDALAKNGVQSYLVWNPGNHYREQKPAFR